MRRRRLAFAMAVMMAFTSIPTGNYHVHAEEVIAEDLIIEDVEAPEELVVDSVEEAFFDEEDLGSDISLAEDIVEISDAVEVLEVTGESPEVTEVLSPEVTEPETEVTETTETTETSETIETVETTETESMTELSIPETEAVLTEGIEPDEFLMEVVEVEVKEEAPVLATDGLPKAERLSDGGDYSVNLNAGESVYYSFTVEDESAKYSMYSTDMNGYLGTFTLYYEENGSLIPVSGYYNYLLDSNFCYADTILESGETYYYRLTAPEDQNISFYMYFEKEPSVTDVEVLSDPCTNTYVSGFDHVPDFKWGLTLDVTYENGKTEYLDPIHSNSRYGYSLEDGSFYTYTNGEKGEQIEYWAASNYDLSGTYLHEIQLFDMPVLSRTVTFLTPEEASVNAVLNIETNPSVSKTCDGHTLFAQFTPEEDGEYAFSAQYANEMYIEDAVTHERQQGISANGKDIYEMKAGTKYYIAAKYISSDYIGSEVTLKVEKGVVPVSLTVPEMNQKDTVNVFELDDFLCNLAPVLTMSDGTFEIPDSIWGRNSNTYGGTTASGYDIEIHLIEGSGENETYADFSNGFPIGNYILEVETSADSDLVWRKEITVTEFSNADVTVTEGVKTEELTLMPGEIKLYQFVAPEDGVYIRRPYMSGWCSEWVYKVEDDYITHIKGDDGYPMEKDTLYVMSVHCSNDYESNYAVKFTKRREIESISIPENLSIIPFDLYNQLRQIPVTITYTGDKTELITEWSQNDIYDNDGTYMGYDGFRVQTDQNVDLDMKFRDSDGNVYVPDTNIEVPVKTGEIIVEISSEDTAISMTENITIQGVTEDTVMLSDGVKTPFAVKKNAPSMLAFTIPAGCDAELFVDVPADAKEYFYAVFYKVNGTEFTYANEYSLYNYYENEDMNDYPICTMSSDIDQDTTYAVIIYTNSDSLDFSSYMKMNLKKKVASISFAEDSYTLGCMDFYSNFYKLPLTVHYTDGTSGSIENWYSGGFWDENENYYNVPSTTLKTENGDAEFGLWLEDTNGNMISTPNWENTRFDAYGEFTLHAGCIDSMVTTEIADVQCTLNITPVPETAEMLTMREDTAFSVKNGEQQYFAFTADKAAEHKIHLNYGAGGSGYVECLEAAEGTISSLVDWYFGEYDEEAEEWFAINTKKDASYILMVKNTDWTPDDWNGTIRVIPEKAVEAVIWPENHTMDAGTTVKNLYNFPITLQYDDGSEEILDSWDYTEADDDYRVLCQYSERDVYFELKLLDSEGNQLDVPYDWSDSELLYGDYTLELTSSTIAETQKFEFRSEFKNVIELIEGESVSGKMAYNEKAVVSFEIKDAGRYKIQNEFDWGIVYDVYAEAYKKDAESGTLRYWTGLGSVDYFEIGEYFMLIGVETYEDEDVVFSSSMEKAPNLTAIDLIEDGLGEEKIAGLDKFDSEELKAAVSYDNGTTETICYNDCTSYDDCLYFNLFRANEYGEYDDWYNVRKPLDVGSYKLTAYVYTDNGVLEDSTTFDVISREEAAAGNILVDEALPATMTGKKNQYTCAFYTPSADGFYLIRSERHLEHLRVFAAEGSELYGQWVDDYTFRVDLTAGQQYIICMYAGTEKPYTLNIRPQNGVQNVVLSTEVTDYIAGLDEWNDNDFGVEVTLENGEIVSLTGNDSYADGNGFRYEIVNTETGEVVKNKYNLKPGTYTVTAIQRTGSAIYRTGSAVQQDPETAKPQASSQPVTFTVSALDSSSLPVLQENEKIVVNASAARMLYAFTPQQSTYYTVNMENVSNSGGWSFFRATEEGLEYAEPYLFAGETYVLHIYRPVKGMSFTVVPVTDRVYTDQVHAGTLGADSEKHLLFKAEDDGDYVFELTFDDADTDFGMYINYTDEDIRGNSWVQDKESIILSTYLYEGCTYLMELYNYLDEVENYSLKVSYEPRKEIKQASMYVKKEAENIFAENIFDYGLYELAEVEFVYTDGTSFVCDAGEGDFYGNWIDYYQIEKISSEDTTETFLLSAWYNSEDLELTAELTLPKMNAPTVIKENTEYTFVVPESKYSKYTITPEKTGDYRLVFKELGNYDIDVNARMIDVTPTYRMDAGTTYEIMIHYYAEEAGTEFTFWVTEPSEATAIRILTPPEPYIYGIEDDGKGLVAEVTYENGTTSLITNEDYYDCYGNEVTIESRVLSGGRRRVYVSCDGVRTSCDVDAFDYTALQQMVPGEFTWTDVKENDVFQQYILSFVPEADGVYDAEWYAEGRCSLGVLGVYDAKTLKHQYFPTELKAGRQYLIVAWTSCESADEFGIKVYDLEGCSTHSWDAGTITTLATCMSEGVLTYRCLNGCGMTKTETIALDKDAHLFTEYVSNEDATTCMKDGTETAVCANGCGAKDTRTEANSALEHVFETYTSDNNVTCIKDGTKTAQCKYDCGTVDVQVEPSKGHVFTLYESDDNATCLSDGTETAICANGCGMTETRIVEGSALEHVYSDESWKVEVAATCTDAGLKSRRCIHGCGMEETAEIPALGHDFTEQSELTEDLPETENRKVYQQCKHDGCEAINVVRVILAAAEQAKIDDVAKMMEELGNEGSEVTSTAVVEQIKAIDNQNLIDAKTVAGKDEDGSDIFVSAMQMIENLDQKLVEETSSDSANVGATVSENSTSALGDIQVTGAAVTVAAEINNDTSSTFDSNETYSAKLTITEQTSQVMMADAQGTESAETTPYMVDISLEIVNATTGKVAVSYEELTLAAPIKITMPVPKGVLTGQTKLIHRVDSKPVEVAFKDNGNGTVTFYAPSLSPWVFENGHCLDEDLWQVEVEATCMTTGIKVNECCICQAAVTAIIEKDEHVFVVESTKEATCTENGSIVYSCTTDGCTQTKTEIIPMGHVFEDKYTIDNKSTCTESGEKSYHCSNCEERQGITIIPATGHAWDDGTITDSPDCENTGLRKYVCNNQCGTEREETLPATGHSYDLSFTVDQAATCANVGSKSRHCKICSAKTDEREIPKTTDHSYQEVEEKREEASCTKTGIAVFQCEVCEKQYTETISVKSHKYEGFTVDQEATCGVNGSKSKHCIYGCGEKIQLTVIPATGNHSLKTVVDQPATCGAEGSQHVECKNCTYKETETAIPATNNHSLKTVVDKEATCGAAGSQHKECANCTYKEAATAIPATGNHSLKTVVDKASTCGAAGSQHKECTNCTYKEAATAIPATGKHSLKTVVDKAATCGAEGSQHVECKNCTYKETATAISATGKHSLKTVVDKAATCGTAGSEHKECTNCTYKEAATAISATGNHSLKTVVDKEATCGAAGSEHKECTNSDCTYKEAATEIPATGKHIFENYTVTKEPTVIKKGSEKAVCSGCDETDTRDIEKLEGRIKLSAKTLKVQLKKSVKMSQIIKDMDETDSVVSWKSSNKKVATISKSGTLKAKKTGKTTITVKLASGVSAKVTVTVQKKAVKTTKSTVSNSEKTLTLKKGKKFTLKPVLNPISSQEKIKYSTSNKKKVTVSSKGQIKAKAKGKATITIRAGKAKTTIKVVVK